MFEICPECYREHFFVSWAYRGMKIETSTELHRCHGCGELKKVVRKVTVNGEVVDLN
jgi:hypothetical protein